MSKKSVSIVENLQKKIEIAQESVANLSDGTLKTVAFQVILERLLMSDELPDFTQENIVDKPAHEVDKQKPQKDKQPKGPKGRVETLIEEGFFSQKRTIGDVKEALEAHTWYHRLEDLGPTLVRLVQEKKLRRIKEPEKEGGKLIWRYSNW